jgi:hypothetical protein
MGIFPVSPAFRYIYRSRLYAALCTTGLAVLLFTITQTAVAAEGNVDLKGPDVVIISGEDKVVYEFRQNGQLRMVRVVPRWGKPYYLVPRDSTKGFGDLERADMLLPQWVIAEF